MSSRTTVTTTIEASWDLKGADPSIEEWIKIADECKNLGVPRTLKLKLERSMDEHTPHRIVMEKFVDETVPKKQVYRDVATPRNV